MKAINVISNILQHMYDQNLFDNNTAININETISRVMYFFDFLVYQNK